jgi:hypothetical protein
LTPARGVDTPVVMNRPPEKGDSNAVTIHGPVTGGAVVAGSHNTVTVSYSQVALPPAESVDIKAALAAIEAALATMESPDQKKIKNAMSEAKDEADKPTVDKAEVGKSLERALEYAQKAAGFAVILEKIQPHVLGAAAWLGAHGQLILKALHG